MSTPVDTLAPRDAYRLWAPAYETETAVSFMDELLVRRLTPALDGRVLVDAGCGTGRRGRPDAARVVGADLTPEMLAQAPRAANAAWVAADVRALPLRPALGDVVWCRLVLGHMPALGDAYAELARVCRPGGAVVVTDFHPQAARAGHTRTFRDGSGRLHGVEHHLHDVSDHLGAARRAGLRMERRLDGRVGPEIRDFYQRAGRLAAYQQATGLPIVLALLFRRA